MELFILIMFRTMIITRIIKIMFKEEKYSNNQLEQNQIILNVICVFHSFSHLQKYYLYTVFVYFLCIHNVYLALEFKI